MYLWTYLSKFLEPTLHITILLHVDDEVTYIYFTVSVTLVDKLGCMVGIVHPLSSSRLTTDCQRSWVCWWSMVAWRLTLPSRPPWPTSSMWTHSARLLMVHRPLALTVVINCWVCVILLSYHSPDYKLIGILQFTFNAKNYSCSVWFTCRAVSLPDDTINICTPFDCQGVSISLYVLLCTMKWTLSADVLTPYTHTALHHPSPSQAPPFPPPQARHLHPPPCCSPVWPFPAHHQTIAGESSLTQTKVRLCCLSYCLFHSWTTNTSYSEQENNRILLWIHYHRTQSFQIAAYMHLT